MLLYIDPPVVSVPANDIVTTIETGRSVRIPCTGTSVNNDHIIEWYRIENTESSSLLIPGLLNCCVSSYIVS